VHNQKHEHGDGGNETRMKPDAFRQITMQQSNKRPLHPASGTLNMENRLRQTRQLLVFQPIHNCYKRREKHVYFVVKNIANI
jgi:hypothetical protein